VSRRSNGEGNIRQRADGRWEGRIRIGQKRRTVYGKTRRDVADQLAQIRQDAMLGVSTAPSSEGVEAYLKEWRQGARHLRPTTAYFYDLLIRVHVAPVIGHMKLKDLAPLHLNETYRRIKGARTREQVHRLLHKALGDAVKLRLLPHNPASLLEVPATKPAKKKRWTENEVRAFITTCSRFETTDDALWLLMLGTSCRIGEALALMVDDVRTMTVPEFALGALRHQRRHAVGGYFFRTKEGNVPWTSDLQKRLKEACLRAGVPEVSSHMLRKTHASLAIAGGVDVKTVQKRLGHATLALTLGLYAEAMEMGDAKAAQTLDTLLGHGSIPAQPQDEEAADG